MGSHSDAPQCAGSYRGLDAKHRPRLSRLPQAHLLLPPEKLADQAVPPARLLTLNIDRTVATRISTARVMMMVRRFIDVATVGTPGQRAGNARVP
jgi:hypothetical protein